MSNQEIASIYGDQWVSFPISVLVLRPPGTLMMRKRIQPSTSQDEHDCLHAAFSSLRNLFHRGGINVTVMDRDVCCKPWIHFVDLLLETTLETTD